MLVFLIDATTHRRKLDDGLSNLMSKYYKVKYVAKTLSLGSHIAPKELSFSVGLLRIATILNANGYHVRYINLEDLEHIISNDNVVPDIIAFSAVCPTLPICSSISKLARERYANVRIVIGGPQINAGRNTTQQLFPNFDKYIPGFDIDAAAMIVDAPANSLKLPNEYVAYSLLPLDIKHYAINTFTTLGCHYSCKYCQDRIQPTVLRDLTGDVKTLIGKIPPSSPIHFFDSTLGNGDMNRINSICNELKQLQHGFNLSCEIRAEQISPNLVRLLTEAGFVEIRVGFESGDKAVLKKNNRSYYPDQIFKKLNIVKDFSNLYVSIYMLIGLAGSNHGSNRLTRDCVKYLFSNHLVNEIKSGIYVPYPVDNIDYAKEGIFIHNNNWSDYDRNSYPVYQLANYSSKTIWDDYLLTTETIIDSWLSSLGLSSFDELHDQSYPEYNRHLLHL